MLEDLVTVGNEILAFYESRESRVVNAQCTDAGWPGGCAQILDSNTISALASQLEISLPNVRAPLGSWKCDLASLCIHLGPRRLACCRLRHDR
jgi:hypothetical protein